MHRLKFWLTLAFSLCPAVASAWPLTAAPAAQTPQPAVARVIAAEPHGVTSAGTGVLMAIDETYGLVVTNWHVVRDATGPITVVFPDGFRSDARVLKTDHDWDLAALAIQRPRAAPLPLAVEPPRPGEPLSIAGYGPEGVYRIAGGRCVAYHTPGGNLPREIIEIDVAARHGDSGGPICNSRGEVAGILFGAGGNMWTGGYTMGSYCGRVRMFLAAAYLDFQRIPGKTMVAEARPPQATPSATVAAATPPFVPQNTPSLTNPPPLAKTGPFGAPLPAGNQFAGNRPNPPAAVSLPASSPVAQVSPVAVASQSEPLPSRTDQIKTILALIGIIAILFHGLRLIGSSVG
jgi:hypothetical protein